MKDLKRSARTLNSTLNILFLPFLVWGLFAVGYHILALHRLLTDPSALTSKMGLTIDWLTLTADHGFGITMDAAVPMKLVQLLSAAIITAIGCRAMRILKQILLPIEVGKPFLQGISGHFSRLSRCAFWLGMAENLSMLASVMLIEKYYGLPSLLVSETVTRVSFDLQFRPAWMIVAVVLTVLATVFRHGEQLQQLADETL